MLSYLWTHIVSLLCFISSTSFFLSIASTEELGFRLYRHVVIIFFVVVVIYTVMTGLLVVIITSGLTKSYLRRRQDCFSVCFPLLPPFFFFISPEICMKMLLSGRPFPPGRGGVGAVVFDGDVFCPGCGGCYFCCCCHCFHSAIVIGFCASLGGGGGWRYMSPTAP